MIKLIFLDIDGVLNTARSCDYTTAIPVEGYPEVVFVFRHNKGLDPLDPICIENPNAIIIPKVIKNG